MKSLKDNQHIQHYISLKEDLDQKKEERNELIKHFTSAQRLYVKIFENLAGLKDAQQKYVINGNQEKINAIKIHMEKAEDDLKDFLEGRGVLKGYRREMTENEISEALKDPRIAKNNPLYLEIAFGMVDKKENKVVSINEVNSIVNNPYVKQYLALGDEVRDLTSKIMDIQAKELIDKKNQFDNEFYKPELEKIDQEIEKQYAKLEEPLQKKEDLISDYGMHEEAALDELSYSERNAIYDAESKINNLDRLKQDLKSRYDSFIPGAKNEGDLLDGISRVKNFLEREKKKYL